MRMRAALLAWAAAAAQASEPAAVRAHPPFAGLYLCGEHRQGELQGLGDALGSDCLVQRMVEEDGRSWPRAYQGDGRRNEDWFGWRAPVLSPCDCEVLRVQANAQLNEPGRTGRPPAGFVLLRRDDGVHFLLAHLQAFQVAAGERVQAGQVLAEVGNNGFGRMPHLHIGAWQGQQALQIQWDLRVLGRL